LTNVPAILVQTAEHASTQLTATIAPVLSDSTDPTVKQVRVIVKKLIENGVSRSFRTKQIFALWRTVLVMMNKHPHLCTILRRFMLVIRRVEN